MLLGELPAFQELFPVESSDAFAEIKKGQDRLKQFEVVQVYHITPMANLESIARYGLVAREKVSNMRITGPRIYVSTTVEDLPWGYVGHANLDIWTFCIPSHLLKPDEISVTPNHYYLEADVPWYKLYLHGSIADVYQWGMETPG